MSKIITMNEIDTAFEKIAKRDKKSAQYGNKNIIRNARKAKAKRLMS